MCVCVWGGGGGGGGSLAIVVRKYSVHMHALPYLFLDPSLAVTI